MQLSFVLFFQLIHMRCYLTDWNQCKRIAQFGLISPLTPCMLPENSHRLKMRSVDRFKEKRVLETFDNVCVQRQRLDEKTSAKECSHLIDLFEWLLELLTLKSYFDTSHNPNFKVPIPGIRILISPLSTTAIFLFHIFVFFVV